MCTFAVVFWDEFDHRRCSKCCNIKYGIISVNNDNVEISSLVYLTYERLLQQVTRQPLSHGVYYTERLPW